MLLADLTISAPSPPRKEAITAELGEEHADVIFAVWMHTSDCTLMSDIPLPLTRVT